MSEYYRTQQDQASGRFIPPGLLSHSELIPVPDYRTVLQAAFNFALVRPPYMATSSGTPDVVARGLQGLSGDPGRLVLDPPATQESPMEQAFKTEKAAFEQQLPNLLARYDGQYVAVSGGRVVDAHPDRVTLVERFFAQHGDSPVFIGYVSRDDRPSRVVTPFRR